MSPLGERREGRPSSFMGHLCSPTQAAAAGVFEVGPAPPGGGGCTGASPIVVRFFCNAEQSGRRLVAQREGSTYQRLCYWDTRLCVSTGDAPTSSTFCRTCTSTSVSLLSNTVYPKSVHSETRPNKNASESKTRTLKVI